MMNANELIRQAESLLLTNHHTTLEKATAVQLHDAISTAAMALSDDSVSIDDEALHREERLAIVLGTEGDGLAAGTSIPVCLFFVAVTCLWGEEYLELGVFASGLIGGLMGFLVYNFNPAKVFMGDTGSLFLGGAVAALAFAYDMPLILVTLGIIYIIETLSDIIQIGYFKLSHGKRVFRMAPFHHHLEMGGWTGKKWKEKEIFVLFTGISLLFAIISFIGVFQRYAL